MKRLCPLVLCAWALAASGQGVPPAFHGYASAWTQDCAEACSPQEPAGASVPVDFAIAAPTAPGEARTAGFEREFAFVSGENVKASVSVYFVCPPGATAGAGGDPCPSRYLQFQAVLSGDARAFCAASLNTADAKPFPVVMCAGESLRRAGRRLGVSFSREVPAR